MIEAQTYRYERKFWAAGMEESEVRHVVRAHSALFFEEYPPRWVNNVYLDTLDLASVRDNADGVSDRDKVRVRWYGELRGEIERPVLEQKIRRGLVGRKLSCDLPAFVFDERMQARGLERHLQAASVPADLVPRLETLRPTLVNRYRRRYYRSADRRFRLTVDTRMAYAPFPARHRWVEARDEVLIELKYGSELESFAAPVTGALPFRIGKSSKYVTGMRLTDPRVRV